MNELAEFLGRYQPFSGATPEELDSLAGLASVLTFQPGAAILVEDGPVSPGAYVVRSGAVELVHDDEVVDVLDVGEAFGHPSMLTGRAPAFTVRARETSEVILIPAEAAVRRPCGPTATSAY